MTVPRSRQRIWGGVACKACRGTRRRAAGVGVPSVRLRQCSPQCRRAAPTAPAVFLAAVRAAARPNATGRRLAALALPQLSPMWQWWRHGHCRRAAAPCGGGDTGCVGGGSDRRWYRALPRHGIHTEGRCAVTATSAMFFYGGSGEGRAKECAAAPSPQPLLLWLSGLCSAAVCSPLPLEGHAATCCGIAAATTGGGRGAAAALRVGQSATLLVCIGVVSWGQGCGGAARAAASCLCRPFRRRRFPPRPNGSAACSIRATSWASTRL